MKRSVPKNSYLWRIESNPPSYLFGTIHVPFNEVWNDIPQNVKDAFLLSQKIFIETDPNIDSNLLKSYQLLPNGETIDEHIPLELYISLQSYIDEIKGTIHK